MIDRLVGDGTVVSSLDSSIHTLFPVAVTSVEGEAVRDWVSREGAVHTLEIGLGYGISALFICEALTALGDPAARHVVMDPNQRTRFGNCGLQVLHEAGVAELVEYSAEPSQFALPRLLGEGRRFDFAFVDGNHRFDGVFVDLVYLGRLLRPAGTVFLDDYQLPAVVRALSFFVKNLGWVVEELSPPDPRHRWAVVRTGSKPDARPFDYYIDF